MRRVLLVEDNELNRVMLTKRLRHVGMDVLIAVDGQEGVDMAIRELPDLILMDINLPVLDGWDAMRQIRSTEQTANIPMIALTAHAMIGERRRALNIGCDAYETKPIDFKVLMEQINQLAPEPEPDV